jgi:CheY-specific phosphatase CheX
MKSSMAQQLKSTLTWVANETLEKLAFLFAFADDERRDDVPEPAVTGWVEFDGLFCGSLFLRVSASVVPELAKNMLGLEDEAEISNEAQQDALKELLNVITGNALPAIAGDQAEFNIGAPEIISSKEARKQISKVPPACVVRLMLEDGYCDVYFFARGQIPELKIE